MTDSKARDKLRTLTVSKLLVLSDIILKRFHVCILRSSEWALSSLPTELANSQTSAFQLFKIHQPIQRVGNLRKSIIRPVSPGEIGPEKGPQHTLWALYRSPTRGSSNLTIPLNEGPLSLPAAWPQRVLFCESENTVSDRHTYNNFYGLAA